MTTHRAPHWAFVAPETREQIRTLLGARASDVAYVMFTARLLQAPRRFKEEDATEGDRDWVVASHDDIQKCRGLTYKGKPYKPEHYSRPWLEAYCEHVNTTWREHKRPNEDGTEGEHRRVHVGFLGGLRTPPVRDAKETYVHAYTGWPRASYDLEERVTFAHDGQSYIARYIEALPPSLYVPTEHAFSRARGLARDYDDDNDIRVCMMGPPRLEASAGGNTLRLHADGYTSMRGDTRREMWPCWVELDLVAAHAGAFAKLASSHKIKTPILNSLLDTGDAWLAACEALNLGPEHRTSIKELALKALYGRAQKNLREECKTLGLPNIASTPLFMELIQARNALRKIAGPGQKGYLKGPNGQKFHLKGKASALLHSVCSAYELLLVLPVYEVATEYQGKGCYVALHQHDGMATGAPDDEIGGEFVQACQAAVASRAEALGVRTRLVRKEHPTQPFNMDEAEYE